MTDEQTALRVKVAELCGENVAADAGFLRGSYRVFRFKTGVEWRAEGEEPWNWTPDFPNDLNACAEFEKGLSEDQQLAYTKELSMLTRNGWAIFGNHIMTLFPLLHATAEQRCRAFIATMEASKTHEPDVRSGAGSAGDN